MHRIALPLMLSLPPALLPALATAQSSPDARPSAILVVDGSGSMWGQIDGVNKIVIAREVVGDLLADLPEDLSLGLMSYGHRRRGDCSDIELLIEPARGNRAQIAQAVSAINPRGRTPMTRAVVEAARALRYTEDAATVILVSDGIETCEADPCAIAAELEAAGVAFTAHVVGFDVAAEPEARAQMQCIAQNTGGRFLTADTAEELAAALQEVAAETVAEPAPRPEPVLVERTVGFTALVDRAGRTYPLSEGVVFEVFRGDELVMDAVQAANPQATLPEGSYRLHAYRLETEEAVDVAFTVTADGPAGVEAVFAEALPPATLRAPASGPVGGEIAVDWTGPNGTGDYIDSALPGAESGAYQTFAYTADGAPAMLRLPAQPGDYVLRYILGDGLRVLAETPITVTAVEQGLTAPATARIGDTIQVGWQGGGFSEDYIDVAQVGADSQDYLSYAYVSDGNPLNLRLPVFPGTYEIRYIVGQDLSVAARTTIEIADIPATLSAPATVAAGASFDLAWTGPGRPQDYVTIARPGDGPLGYVDYAYVADGPKVTLTAPESPGTYELRYIADGPQARVLTRGVLTVN